MRGSAERQQPRAVAAAGRLPDFFIVGQAKSGTTALYEMLRRHPQIFMPELKEPWFFAPELRSPFRDPRTSPRPETIEEYRALFASARPDQRAGEASSSYLTSVGAAERIAAVQPAARIIATFREPASFLRSLHFQCVQNHVETETDFRRAIELEPERRQGRRLPRSSPRPQALLYSDHVRYAEQLRRYHSRFPPEQVLVLIYDDFRADNEATLRRVLRFLEVDDAAALETIEAAPTVRVRSRRLHELMRAVSVGRGPVSRTVKASVKTLTPQSLRRGSMRALRRNVVFAEPRPPDEEFMLELRRRYKDEVVALGEYLGRDLVSLWGYDAIG
jgi:hypothetical protein